MNTREVTDAELEAALNEVLPRMKAERHQMTLAEAQKIWEREYALLRADLHEAPARIQ
ncbi:MAG TPA: hypothetical protein VMH26_09405 [Burkholderiales bacterium]|nr:hypothetical protein [Burkholderiales bacterium]